MKPKKQSNLRYVYFEKKLGSYYSPPTCFLSSYFYPPPPLCSVDETEETVKSVISLFRKEVRQLIFSATLYLPSYFYPPPLCRVDETEETVKSAIRLLRKEVRQLLFSATLYLPSYTT